eukprot:gene9961-10116_t
MGIPKTSRKGKKAWRRNIDAGEVEEFLQDETHKERREPSVQTLKDEDLFVLDKEASDDLVPAAVRKRSRQEVKPLRSQLFLASLGDGITPVPQGPKRKMKGQGGLLPGSTAVKEEPAPRPATGSRKKLKHRVAHEYKQELKQELMPKAPAQHAPEGYRPADELDQLLVDAEQSEDEEQQGAVAAVAAADDNEIVLDDDDDAGGCRATAASLASAGASEGAGPAAGELATAAAASKKTRKDRNREARRKHQDTEAAARKALKQQRQQLEALQELQQQLVEEEQEKAATRIRKQVNKADKAAVQPPRLGKHKFEAAATAVLTSDEVTGSLRELQPCFLVTADRFKALQKRGLIEPRKATGRKQGKRVQYVTGERREKAEERQQQVADLVAARKKAKKQAVNGAKRL